MKTYEHFEANKPITINTDHIIINNHRGKWYAIDETIYNSEKVYLLEHETYGDEAGKYAEEMRNKYYGEYSGKD